MSTQEPIPVSRTQSTLVAPISNFQIGNGLHSEYARPLLGGQPVLRTNYPPVVLAYLQSVPPAKIRVEAHGWDN
jgi:hypothetical protein